MARTIADDDDDALYDLQGRRVSETAPKGIYIRRGRRIVIK